MLDAGALRVYDKPMISVAKPRGRPPTGEPWRQCVSARVRDDVLARLHRVHKRRNSKKHGGDKPVSFSRTIEDLIELGLERAALDFDAILERQR